VKKPDDIDARLAKQLARYNEILERTRTAPRARSPAWFIARFDGWGSSETDAALGESPYKSPAEAVTEKARCSVSIPGWITQVGIDSEPIIREFAGKLVGAKIIETCSMPTSVPFIGDSSDGQYLDGDGRPVVVEIKTLVRRKTKKVIPAYYRNQIQTHLFSTGFDRCLYIEARVSRAIGDGRPGSCGTFTGGEFVVFEVVPAVAPVGFWAIPEYYMEMVPRDVGWSEKVARLGDLWKEVVAERRAFAIEVRGRIAAAIPEYSGANPDELLRLALVIRYDKGAGRKAGFDDEDIAVLCGALDHQ
jgi:hypothetical protein